MTVHGTLFYPGSNYKGTTIKNYSSSIFLKYSLVNYYLKPIINSNLVLSEGPNSRKERSTTNSHDEHPNTLPKHRT